MIDLKSLRSIAEKHGAELQIGPHPSQAAVVLSIKKGNVTVSSDIDASLCREKAENGTPLVEVILGKMIERLEEFLDGRVGESNLRPGG